MQERETIGVLEDVPNKGNLGDIYWEELNHMIFSVFNNIGNDFSSLEDKHKMSAYIKEYCPDSIKVSERIGFQIKHLHEALIIHEDKLYSKETVLSEDYLKNYTEKLNYIVKKIQNKSGGR